MMAAANTPREYRFRMLALAIAMACHLGWLVPISKNGAAMARAEWFGEEIPALAKYMRTFGTAGVVKVKKRSGQPKANFRGAKCLMAGYAAQSSGDCYKMYDPTRNVAYVARDVIWAGTMYFSDPNRPSEGEQGTKKVSFALEEDSEAAERSAPLKPS